LYFELACTGEAIKLIGIVREGHHLIHTVKFTLRGDYLLKLPRYLSEIPNP
jgi:hypothetical protein